jgi:hypothetical protein
VLVGLVPVLMLARMSRPMLVLSGRSNGGADQDLSADKSL